MTYCFCLFVCQYHTASGKSHFVPSHPTKNYVKIKFQLCQIPPQMFPDTFPAITTTAHVQAGSCASKGRHRVEQSLALQTFLPSEISEKKTKFNYKQQREELSLSCYGTQDSSARLGWGGGSLQGLVWCKRLGWHRKIKETEVWNMERRITKTDR